MLRSSAFLDMSESSGLPTPTIGCKQESPHELVSVYKNEHSPNFC